jgi:REP element-mobilizing transposase RayT
MSIRKEEFFVGGLYHIYNRGVDKRIVFEDKQDFYQFLDMMDIFNQDRSLGSRLVYNYPINIEHRGKTSMLVEVVAFCLLPNHFHLILREKVDGGISKFMQKLGTGYTMYFNQKNERSGALFQGKFKSKLIETQKYLEYLSVYVNLNFRIHGVHKYLSKKQKEKYDGDSYRSSLHEYIYDDIKNRRCVSEVVLKSFKNKEKYLEYANRQVVAMIDKKDNEFNKRTT